FVSYVAKKAGFPLGRVSQGIWEPKNLYLWAKSQGWYFPRGARRPKVGDLAVHGYSHTGIVVRITRKGVVYTADANWGDSVKYNLLPLSASGYIRLPSEPRTE
ncbi:MAG: CHAP domain-containing protein, partial [Solirubrobacteraceae bacterium]